MTISAVFGTSTMTLVSLVAHDQAAVGGRFIHGHAGLPVRAELGRNAEPAHPVAAHGRRLVARPQHAQGQRAERRTERRQRDPLDRRCRRLGEQQSHLLAAAAALARPHAGARETLDLILVDRPVAQERAEAARAHLRRLPGQIARRPRLDELTPRDLLALADVHLPAARVDQRAEPRLPVTLDLPRRLHRRLGTRLRSPPLRGAPPDRPRRLPGGDTGETPPAARAPRRRASRLGGDVGTATRRRPAERASSAPPRPRGAISTIAAPSTPCSSAGAAVRRPRLPEPMTTMRRAASAR